MNGSGIRTKDIDGAIRRNTAALNKNAVFVEFQFQQPNMPIQITKAWTLRGTDSFLHKDQ